MSYKIQNSDLDQFIYGFGASSSFNSFQTEVISDGLKINGQPAKGVPYDATTMPFNTVQYGGFQIGGDSTWFSTFAQVGRFITSSTARYQKFYSNSVSSDDLIPVYYQRGSSLLFGHTGKLFIGGTGSDYLVSSSCPPVVMFAFQACGGNSGIGYTYNVESSGNVIREGPDVVATGGGGGAGAFMCCQIDLLGSTIDYDPILVFKYKIKDRSIQIFNPNATSTDSPFAVLYGGDDGTDGSVSSNYSSVSKGRGGAKGSGIIYNSNIFKVVYSNISQSGSYGRGGDGFAYTKAKSKTQFADRTTYDERAASQGSAAEEYNEAIKINNRTDSESSIKGGSGGYLQTWYVRFDLPSGGGGGAVLGGYAGTSDYYTTAYGGGYGGQKNNFPANTTPGNGGDHVIAVYW